MHESEELKVTLTLLYYKKLAYDSKQNQLRHATLGYNKARTLSCSGQHR